MKPDDRSLTGMALMLGFCFIAPWIDVSSKLAAAGVPVATITLARYLVQGALMLPATLAMGFGLRLVPRVLALTGLRALVSVISTLSFIAALRFMPIADALAVAFVEPFIILLIGRFVMHEQVGPRRVMASVVGFCGSLLVIQPAFAHFGLAALLPLGTAFGFAFYILVTRSLAPHLHPVPMQFHTAWMGALICLPIFAIGAAVGEQALSFSLPSGIFWLWCFTVGLASTISHMSMTYALRFAPSSTLAPLHYAEIVPAVLFSYLVFDDFPNLLTWAGIVIIVGSGLYVIHRERISVRSALASRSLAEAP